MAREIEGTTSSHLAAELENGDDDEENAFSAVVRDPGQSKDHYYSRNMPSNTDHLKNNFLLTKCKCIYFCR